MSSSELKEPLIDVKQDGNYGEAFGLTTDFKFEDIFVNTYNDTKGRDVEQRYQSAGLTDHKFLENKFQTDFQRGLDPNKQGDFERRDKLWGNNKLKPPKPNRIIDHVIECLGDKTLITLLIAAAVSLVIGILKEGIKTGWLEGTAIFFAVFIVCSISSYMNWKQVEEFNILDQKNKIKDVFVIRNGEELKLTNEDVLVGDIMRIKYGNICVVDGIVVEGDLVMDEGPVTGNFFYLTFFR